MPLHIIAGYAVVWDVVYPNNGGPEKIEYGAFKDCRLLDSVEVRYGDHEGRYVVGNAEATEDFYGLLVKLWYEPGLNREFHQRFERGEFGYMSWMRSEWAPFEWSERALTLSIKRREGPIATITRIGSLDHVLICDHGAKNKSAACIPVNAQTASTQPAPWITARSREHTLFRLHEVAAEMRKRN